MFQTIKTNLLSCLFLLTFLSSCIESNFNDFNVGGNTSSGGSLASFTIVNNHLYAVNSTSIIPIDISDLAKPEPLEIVTIGTGIETIFPYKDQLFIGSNSALFIYDISDPEVPVRTTFFQHATGCDPVVVKDDYAYVTIRDGVSCNNFFRLNVLDIINVADPFNTFLVREIPLTNPRGLATGCNDKLFVCDGPSGLLQFDITDPEDPVLDTTYAQFTANDVLIRDDLLILTGADGIYQFRCTDEELLLLSNVPISL